MQRQPFFGGLACLLLLTGLPRLAAAEKIDMSPEALRHVATHVIVGKVVSIDPQPDDQQIAHYTAQVKISRVEKGAGLRVGDVCSVRYWHRALPPKATGTLAPPHRGSLRIVLRDAGHRGLPKAGDTLRVYLARNAYDGASYENKDGGYNVIYANGFQRRPVTKKGTP